MFKGKAFLFWICAGILMASFAFAKSADPLSVADAYYAATLFDRAAAKYLEIIPQLENSEERSVAYLRLALSYYHGGRYRDLAAIPDSDLSSIDDPRIKKPLIEAKYWQSVGLNRIGRYEEAARGLRHYLSNSADFDLLHEREALVELGLSYFRARHYELAKEVFSSLSADERALFYLAYIAIDEERFVDAKEMVDKLARRRLSPNMVSAAEFLRGEIFYRQKDYPRAAEHFAKIPLSAEFASAGWYLEFLRHLGLSYLNLAVDVAENRGDRLVKAEQVFLTALDFFRDERLYLDLGRTYLLRGELLGEETAGDKLEELLSGRGIFSSKDAEYQAFILRAEAKRDYSERKLLFNKLRGEEGVSGSLLARILYLQGLDELQEGKTRGGSASHLRSALSLLESAFEKLYDEDRPLAALAYKYRVEVLFHLGGEEAGIRGLELIGKLLNDYRRDLFALLRDQDEIYYLQGRIAVALYDLRNEGEYLEIAKKSLSHLLNSYPRGAFFQDALYLLASLHYRLRDYENAEREFSDYARLAAGSKRASEALFFAALSAEKCDGGRETARQYFRCVFEDHSQSAYAAESYFRYYSYSEYLTASKQVLDHLRRLGEKFPDSPFVINASYLLGLLSTDGALVDRHYERAEALFDALAEKEGIADDRYEYFRSVKYQAMLDRALKLISSSSCREAEDILRRAYSDFRVENFNRAMEKIAYHLAKCYLSQGKDKSANEIFEAMLSCYGTAKITRGYYLSRIWFEKGNLAFIGKDYLLALDCFARAEDAAKGGAVSSDELLELWLQEGLSHLALGDCDKSMLIFSRAINYDVASALRIKAMYLRSLVYEKEGRRELARRQLEAAAKKGGVWALKAREKLEKEYVFR